MSLAKVGTLMIVDVVYSWITQENLTAQLWVTPSTEYDMHIMVLQIANVLNHVSYYYVIDIKQNELCSQYSSTIMRLRYIIL